ncbi:unnamed protein product [Vicia faba]|uniref:Uncharacterized protein n=1 Tax=Vicia faba TaxID=3906 RepID=A0AAV0YIW8_VICFA|nr:unnamed protein product [Vicia faba]
MSYSSQAPPYYSSTPMRNENVPNVGLDKFPDFSTQAALGGMSGGHGATPNAEDSTHVGGNSGSVGSGSKRAHESDASDSNSVESSARPMGRDATKKRLSSKEHLDDRSKELLQKLDRNLFGN